MPSVFLIGFGVEGQAAARYFRARGETVTASDAKADVSQLPAALKDDDGFHLMTESAAGEALAKADLVLRSPGVPPANPLVMSALARGVPVTTPTGYWLAHHAPENTVTVTGTKGKSTTVSILARLLSALGHEAAAIGNIGTPPLAEGADIPAFPVLEVSSYMCHDLPTGPHTHLVTNLFREHTPWHGSESSYRAAKLRPYRQSPPAPGVTLRAIIAEEALPDCVQAVEDLVPMEGAKLDICGPLTPADISPLFRVTPNLLALRLAAAHALTLEPPESVRAGIERLTDIQGLASRFEHVPSTDGRVWINDALATVPEAVVHALSACGPTPVTALIGGLDREQAFAPLIDAFAAAENVTPLIFGAVAERLADALRTRNIDYRRAASFADALQLAAEISAKGSVILFSPAAASEPPHGSYVERAQAFRAAAASA